MLKIGLFAGRNNSVCKINDLVVYNGFIKLKSFRFFNDDFDLDFNDISEEIQKLVERLFRSEKQGKDSGKDIWKRIENLYVNLDTVCGEMKSATGRVTNKCVSRKPFASDSCPKCNNLAGSNPTRYVDCSILELRAKGSVRLHICTHVGSENLINGYNSKFERPKRVTAWPFRHDLDFDDMKVLVKHLNEEEDEYDWFFHVHQRWGCLHFQGIYKDDVILHGQSHSRLDLYVVDSCIRYFMSIQAEKLRTKASLFFPLDHSGLGRLASVWLHMVLNDIVDINESVMIREVLPRLRGLNNLNDYIRMNKVDEKTVLSRLKLVYSGCKSQDNERVFPGLIK